MAEYNFTLNQGADLTVPFLLQDASGSPIDLTGYSAAMQVRRSVHSSEAVDTLLSNTNRLIIDAGGGRITATFPHDVTESYPAKTLIYDIEITSASNERTRILQGKITVSPEVTRV